MRLEIDGKEADLSNSIIAITRKVIDLGNLALRNIDITNRLKLPKTNTNQEIFESADQVYTNGSGLDKLYKAKIIDQFFTFNGLGFLNEANNSYSFQLSENSKEVLSNLNDKINMLPYDQYDFTFGEGSYNTLKLLSTSNVWVWPIVAMHEQKTEDNTRFEVGANGLKYSRPVFSFNKILFDAIEAQGWTIELDTDIIERLGISSNASKFWVTSYQKTLATTLTLGAAQNITNLNTNDFEYNVTTASTTIRTGATETIYRLRGNISTVNDATIKFISTSVGSGKVQTKEFKVKSTQTYIDFKTSAFKPSSPDTDVSVQITIEGDSGNFTFEDTLLYTIVEEQKLGDLSTNPLLNYRIKAFDNMPDKKQIDILRDAMKITNSIIEPDSFNKTIKLRTLNNLSKLNAIDWSEKFDADNFSQTNRISGYAKTNNLIYDNDDTINSDLGEESFDINNEALEDLADVLKLEYGASNDVAIENFETLPVASFDIYNDTERENEINDRLVYIYDNDIAATYTLGRFLEIDWRSLKSSYYENWFKSFERLRIIDGDCDLNQLDVIGHDFLKVVYIDYFKSHFFVLEISDYTPGRKTSVELFKFM